MQNLHREYSQIQVDEKAGKKLTLDQENAKKEWDETVSEMHMDILTMMLFGMGMMKLGLLTGKYSTRFYVWMALISFAIGLPSHTWLVWRCAKEHFSMES